MAPDAFLTLWAQLHYAMSLEDWSRAIEAAHAALAISGRIPVVLAFLGISLVRVGDRAGARAVYRELQSRGEREYVSPMVAALLEAALGDTDAAAGHCNEAVRQRDPMFIPFLRRFSGAEDLIALPEHRRLVASLGLPGVPIHTFG